MKILIFLLAPLLAIVSAMPEPAFERDQDNVLSLIQKVMENGMPQEEEVNSQQSDEEGEEAIAQREEDNSQQSDEEVQEAIGQAEEDNSLLANEEGEEAIAQTEEDNSPQSEEEDQQAIAREQEARDSESMEEQNYGNVATVEDIIALLQGKDITMVDSRAQVQAQSTASTFVSGLQSFVSQLNKMFRRYKNYNNCFSSMTAEMQSSDEDDDELVKMMVDKMADVQGMKNLRIRQLFQRIRNFITNTQNRGSKLYHDIRNTLTRLISSYRMIISCIRKFEG